MLEQTGRWMATNGAAVYGSRAWTTLGEGQRVDGRLRTLPGGHLGKRHAEFTFSTEDFRFTRGRDGHLYAFCMTVPDPGQELLIKSLAGHHAIDSVSLLGYDGRIRWEQTADGLRITYPHGNDGASTAVVFRISGSI